MFDRLVQNALDFMERALKQIEKDPKSSLIFFWTGLELFVKARLLREHWSLILTDPQKANLSNFKLGNFVSISFTEAIKRIRNVCGISITGGENKCFQVLRDHRNKLVHFFNPDYATLIRASAIEQVAIEQCLAWYFLHQWLTVNWKKEFQNYHLELDKIHKLINKNRKFFLAKFQALEVKLKAMAKKGTTISKCVVCDCKSTKEDRLYQQTGLELIRLRCLVCDFFGVILQIPCPECNNMIDIEDLGEGQCGNCQFEICMTELIEKYGENMSWEELKIDEPNAYCSDCEYSEAASVIPLDDGTHLCLSCLSTHERIANCEYCNAKITGDSEGTYLSGCVLCEGLDI